MVAEARQASCISRPWMILWPSLADRLRWRSASTCSATGCATRSTRGRAEDTMATPVLVDPATTALDYATPGRAGPRARPIVSPARSPSRRGAGPGRRVRFGQDLAGLGDHAPPRRHDARGKREALIRLGGQRPDDGSHRRRWTPGSADARIGMVFQDPSTSLNPTLPLGEQLARGAGACIAVNRPRRGEPGPKAPRCWRGSASNRPGRR
jgi:hypothetical protein